MELTQVDNTNQFPMVQNNTVSLSSTSLEKVGQTSTSSNRIKNDVVETTSMNNSEFLANISSSVQHISKLQTLQNETSTQIEMVKNFGQMVSGVASDSLDSYQGDVQDFISSFNSKSLNSTQKMEKIMDEKESDKSHTYFDGILGAKPLSRDDLLKEAEQQQTRLEQVNKTLNDKIMQASDEVKSSFSGEKEKSSQQNSFTSSIDFEQQSQDFSKDTIKNFDFSNTMTDTQTNVEPVVGEKLLAS